jgi:hypothetical protein
MTRLLLVLTAMATAACATMNVGSYLDRRADLRRYRTYTWDASDRLTTGDPRLDNNEIFARCVRNRVERELANRGFVKQATGSADLIVHYHASVTQKIDVFLLDPTYPDGDPADARSTVYDAGTLVVDFVDSQHDEVVWRGWAEGSLEGAIDDQVWLEARVEEAVRRIFQRLPASAGHSR